MALRALSGIQPSGTPHLGNYYGAIKQFIQSQESGEDVMVFVADWHSLTTIKSAEELSHNIRSVVATYLACGLDPNRVTIYQQSDIKQIQELSWVLSCGVNVSKLKLAHSYKDKVEKGIDANVGLFTYPVLMAADILGVQADVVPVGKDQKQHLEYTRDIASKFNNDYGKTFKVPEPRIQSTTATIVGTNGQKMGKSAKNTIDMFESDKKRKKQVNSIVTRPIQQGEPLPWEDCSIANIFELMASPSEVQDLKKIYESGNIGYGQAKQVLLDKIHATFDNMRGEYLRIFSDQSYIDNVLKGGREKAEPIVDQTLREVRKKVGLSKE